MIVDEGVSNASTVPLATGTVPVIVRLVFMDDQLKLPIVPAEGISA